MDRILIRQARVFDGKTALGPRDLFMEAGRIQSFQPKLDTVDQSLVIEADGKTVIPGLIDSHVHAFGSALEDALPFGVTTVLDMFTDVQFAAEMRRQQAAGPIHDRAHLLSAGNLATAPAGHGTQYGVKVETLSSPEEADDFVARRIDEGSDYIKIIWEPGDGSWPTLDEATIKAVIDASHRRGMLAVIHVTRYEHTRRAIEMGVDGLAHIFGDREPEDGFAELVKERGVFVVPTLSVRASAAGIAPGAPLLDDEEFAALLTPQQRRSIGSASGFLPAATFDHAMKAVRKLHAAGVTILAGTDAPNPGTTYGASLHGELRLLVECGLSPAEALGAATSQPAEVFGISGRGRIEAGSVADLVIIDGDPTSQFADTRRIHAVIKEGALYDNDERRERVAALIEQSQVPAPAPDTAVLASGLISDFMDGLTARFGAGWAETSDAMMGGSSSVALEVVDEGADSPGALSVQGEVTSDYLFPWAGAMFSPGNQPMAPADLSSKKGVAFSARGDGGKFHLAVMSASRGFMPANHQFPSGERWQRHEVTFEQLGLDAGDVTAIMFVCYERREFHFEIDDVTLV